MPDPEVKKPDQKSNQKKLEAAKQSKGQTNPTVRPTVSLNSDTAVPQLKYGGGNNFDLFKKRVAIACLERYKNLGRLIVDERYYVPPMIDAADYDLGNDPYEVERVRFREAHKRRDKEIDDMKVDRSSMFAYLISKLSKESLDEIQGHKDWKSIDSERDPLRLWLTVKECHQTLTTSKVASVIKKTAREEYAACKQGMYEHIVDYKRRFDARLDALTASGNAVPDAEDTAMDFLYGLDNNRYADFKAELVNDLQKGIFTQPKTLNEIYLLASRRVVVRAGKENSGGATFATVEEGSAKKSNRNKQDGAVSEKTKAQKAAEKLAKMKCFNCGEKGHLGRNCPHKLKEDEETGDPEPPMAGMTLACECYATSTNRVHQWYEVCLDNGSQVNIVDPRLLSNLRTCSRTYRSMNGAAATESVGYLDGFFDCQACTTCPANIISMADVEDLYPVTYVQGESITVHMEDREVVFHRRDKMYVADFSDWVVGDEDRVQELHIGLSLMTAADRERMYTRKEVRRSLEAGEFLRSLGYPTEREALNFVRDGNVTNIPFTVDEVKRFYDIYGPQVEGIRGRTTNRHAVRTVSEDSGVKMERTVQEVVADVMHVASEKFLISVSSPLELLMTCHVKDLSKDSLGKGIQSHVSTLRSRGFEPIKFYVDPHKSLTALKGEFPGMEIDDCGAGDHLDKVDTRIRRIKEMVRSIIAGLPYRLPRERLKDLVTYAVSRINLKRTSALIDNVSPRVKFTGVRPGYEAEFGLAFGDYVEPTC